MLYHFTDSIMLFLRWPVRIWRFVALSTTRAILTYNHCNCGGMPNSWQHVNRNGAQRGACGLHYHYIKTNWTEEADVSHAIFHFRIFNSAKTVYRFWRINFTSTYLISFASYWLEALIRKRLSIPTLQDVFSSSYRFTSKLKQDRPFIEHNKRR